MGFQIKAIVCNLTQIMFLKYLLIINASDNTQSFLEEIRVPLFAVIFSCFQIHTVQYQQMTQGTFYLQCREQDGDNLHRTCRQPIWHVFIIVSSVPYLQSFSDQGRNCTYLCLVYLCLSGLKIQGEEGIEGNHHSLQESALESGIQG